MESATPNKTLRAALSAVACAALVACGGADDESSNSAKEALDGGERQQALALPPATAALAKWSAPQSLSLVPVAGAVLPNGKVMLWSAEERMSFSATGRTYTSLYDPADGTFSERLVSNTGHNMFCPGTTNLPDGRILVNGGIDSGKTSIYDPVSNNWSTAATMNIARGYNANTLLQDGSVFTLGGSWSGGVGSKHGEVWTATGGWRRMTGVPVDSMWAGTDTSRDFGNDAHMWLIPTGNGRVLYAGPSVNMQWISTVGNGSVEPAGRRGDDEFSVNGTAVMYDIGKILKNGGAPLYEGANANANSYIIDVNNGVSVRKIAPMAYRRAFHNDVVLPNGQVLAIGGQTYEHAFYDDNSVLAPELFDPASESWTTLPAMAVPRNYHGISLLLPDARVLTGGGGLCGGCAYNHPDVQILSPHYLFNPDGSAATRPAITGAPATVGYGTTMDVTTDSAVAAFSMVRIGSTTHTVNNDQRRVPLTYTASGNGSYRLSVPSNPGILLPGYWMLFAMNASGVPSVAKIVNVSNVGAPVLTHPGNLSAIAGRSFNAAVVATTASGALSYSATGLPAGMTINASTGVISGMASAGGSYRVTILVSNGTQTVSTELVMNVSIAGSGSGLLGQYFANTTLSGNAVLQRTETPNFFWGTAAPGTGVPADAFSARWIGEIEAPSSGTAVLQTISDDGVRLWFENKLAIDNWTAHGPTTDNTTVTLVAGKRYPVMLEYADTGGDATLKLNWQLPGTTAAVAVPADRLYPGSAPASSNVAQGKIATQSSLYQTAVASRAVDGNTNGVLANNSTTHTAGTATQDWWQVDLGRSYRIDLATLWNRTDCCTDRLQNFSVFVSGSDMTGRTRDQLLADPNVINRHVGTTSTASLSWMRGIPVNGVGRFVRVQLDGVNFLSLAEVQVFGTNAEYRTPSITAPGAQQTVAGTSTSLSVAASDPDGNPLTFSATGLPAGLSINADSGVISGVPSAAGSFNVSVTATNGGNLSASTGFVWTVQAAPPTIGSFAAPAIGSGGAASYVAPVIGSGPYEYQWDFGDGSAPTAFSSTSGANHSFANAGVYTVTLTVRSSDGSSVTRSFIQAVTGSASVGKAMNSTNLVLEPRASASTRLWTVNPDNDSVSVFDTATRAKVAEVGVGSQPRTLALASDGRVWVVNKASATISIINASNLTVAQTIALPRGSLPYGIVFNRTDGSALVALEGSGQVVKLAANGGLGASTTVGANPRHLSISANGDRLLVSRFVSPPLPGEGTATVTTTDANGAPVGGEVVVLNPATLAIQRTIVLRHSDKLDTTVQGRGLPNYLGAAVISPDGQSAWVPSKQDNVKRGMLRDGQNLDFQNTVRAISSRIDLQTQSEDYAARVDHDNAGVASAAAFHPNGVYVFVALETNRQVAVLDAAGRRELFRIEVGRAPQGLVVSDDGKMLYVQNFMDRSVSMVDLTPLVSQGEMRANTLTALPSVATEKLSATVLKGKQFFYDARDPRLARDSYMSCAACHNDGGHDGRTWDFTGLGEGLRNTIALRGRGGAQGFQHWSANFDEIQDFEGQIRNFAQGTGLMSNADFNAGTRGQSLGTKKAGVSADLDALAAYLGSLNSFAPSPYRAANGTLSSAAQAGRTVFVSKNCASCHGGVAFTNSSDATGLRNVGTLKSSSGQRLYGTLSGIDIPTLRDVWATGPYLHDGSASTLSDAVRAHTTLGVSAAEAESMAAYLREIGSDETSAPGATPATGTGLLGKYFSNNALSGNPVLQRTEAINFNWGTGAPATGVPADNFSIQWTGTIEAPSTGTFYLRTNSDDGVRVWLNNALVIDNWTAHGATLDTTGAISLVANQRYAIRVEYMELTGNTVMALQWRLPGSTSYAVVPANRLYPN